MRNSILTLSLLFVFSFAFAQDNTDKEPTQTSKPTTIVFKSTVYDFGTVNYGEEAKGEFIFKNISKNKVQLTNVKASCGCTGTEWPREEIKRKKKGTIFVSYDTKRVGKFHKNVYVYVDGNSNPIQLEVKGEVLKPEDGSIIKAAPKTISPNRVMINANTKTEVPNGKSKSSESNNSSVEGEKESKKEKSIKKEESIKLNTNIKEKQSSKSE